MKEEILKRAMFAMPLSGKARNSGIMEGFEEDDYEEPPEELPSMARTPQNPEVLMNNLRGDFRSIDARYQELAQMVGEEAAMETPPEVLAMLQTQLAAQGGIGALPQAPGMPAMPPQGGIPMPPQMPTGMPVAQPAAPAMPQGMESAGPFGPGAEAPPTPDGMPPVRAAVGAFITPATRAAQFLADKAGTYGSAANAALGRMFMPPTMTQPFLENVRGAGGRYTAEQIQRGGELLYPTFTQGLVQGAATLADKYPRAAQLAAPALGALGLAGGVNTGPGVATPERVYPGEIPKDTPESLAQLRESANKPPLYDINMVTGMMTERGKEPVPIPVKQPPSTPAPRMTPQQIEAAAGLTYEEPGVAPSAVPAEEKPSVTDFIKKNLQAEVKSKTKGDRIREGAAEYEPLFREVFGDNKEASKINALLLLSEAGLKLAGSTKPTLGMAIGEAFAGVPRGMAAIAAQERDLEMRAKSAALQQAMGDIESENKYAQAMKLEMLKGDMRVLGELAKKGGNIVEDGGAGLRISKTKDGSFLGTAIDPNDPTVRSAVTSRFTLNPSVNPFVEDRGQAPTTVETNKDERIKLTNTLRSLDNSLATLDNLKGVYTSAYGPNAWFVDKVNNLLVPVDPTGVVKPNFDVADAATRVQTGLNSVLKNIASANDSGRVAVQEQEWARENAKRISDPVKFFADKELAAQQFNSLDAMLRNARQQVLTQLGYEKNDYVLRTPNTGTKNDPFVIPADPEQQKTMFSFLGQTIGKVQDPRATVYLRLPNGKVDAFSPTQLQGLLQ